MQNTPNKNTLPAGMALVETNDGRWFPALTPRSEIPGLVLLINPFPLIPPALEPLNDPRKGYMRREEAIEAYCTWDEAASLPIRWAKLAARTEMYPERNAWYLDEIAQLTGDDTPLLVWGTEAYAVVVAKRNEELHTISTVATTLDEAIEALYKCVCDWYQEQALQCAS